MELLAINHTLPERRDNFVPQLMKLSHILVVLQLARGAHFSAVELDNAIWFISCGIVLNGPGSLVVSIYVRA